MAGCITWRGCIYNAAAGVLHASGSISYLATGATINGLRFGFATASNITRGSFRLYGIAK